MSDPEPPPEPHFPRALALLVAGAFFMENLDGTIISTAAPKMADSFGVRPVDINIVMTAYLLAVAVLVPASGWVAERFGSRRIFVLALVVFTVASGLCAVGQDLFQLILARVAQGAGGAMMVPVGRLVVLRATTRPQMIRAIAFLTWPALAAPIIAPAVGGLIATYTSWRWIFVLNLPLGVVAVIVALRLVPQIREHDSPPLDWIGFLLLGVGLGALVAGMDNVGHEPVRWTLVIGGTVVGLAVLALGVRHLRRAAAPMLDLSVLRFQTFRVSVLSGSVARLVIMAVPFVLPLAFQVGFGWSPLRSGVLVLCLFAGNMGIKPATTPLLRRFGFRGVLIWAGLGSTVTIAACGFLQAQTPLWVIVAVLTLSGVFRSVSFSAYNSITYAAIEDHDMSRANALSTTIQQIATGLGIALGALVLRLAAPLASAIGLSGSGPYHVAFVVLAGISAITLIESLQLPRDAGEALTGAGPR